LSVSFISLISRFSFASSSACFFVSFGFAARFDAFADFLTRRLVVDVAEAFLRDEM
jgi:hypothetical protein